MVIWTVSSIIMAIVPYLNAYFIDFLVCGERIREAVKLALIMATIGLTGTIISYITNLIMKKLINLTFYEILNECIKNTLHTKLRIIESLDSSYLTQRLFTDVNTITNFVISNYLSIFFNGFILIWIIILFINIDLILTVFSFILILLYIVIYIRLKNPLYESSINKKEADSIYYQTINDQLKSLNHIQTNVMFKQSMDAMRNFFDTYLPITIRFEKMIYLFDSDDKVVTTIFQSMMFVYGAIQLSVKNMTIGQFIMINSYFSIFINIGKYYINLMKEYQTSKSSYDRIKEIYKFDKIKDGNKKIDKIYKISTKMLNYSYEKEYSIFSNFNEMFEIDNIYIVVEKMDQEKVHY